jgi:hypothetical protein
MAEGETGWLRQDIAQWKKAPLISRKEVSDIIEGFLGGVGVIAANGDNFRIVLPGKAAAHTIGEGWKCYGPDDTRWIEVERRKPNIVCVKTKVQDKFTLAIADALLSSFYHVQDYQDFQVEQSSKAAS